MKQGQDKKHCGFVRIRTALPFDKLRANGS
jgi:hypothetical protein